MGNIKQEMADFSATLNTGAKMPRGGLGTWKAPAEKTKEAVMTAVKAGYRMLDCANDYDNEHVIGEALKELFAAGVVKREELFVQAKTGHEVLKHPDIAKIAAKHGKSTANVVIRWHLQMGGTLCTKSVTPSRIEENFNVWDFKLTAEDMAVMDSLNVGWRHLLWAETSMHPDYPFKDCLPWDYKVEKPGVGATAGAK